MTLRQGQIITVLAETLSRHGDAVAIHGDGTGAREVHVGGLFPGETADVAIEYLSRQRPRAHASLIQLRSSAPGRQAAPCPHYGACGGCSMMELDVKGQRLAKRNMMENRYHLSVDRVVGMADNGEGYRWSSKRIVRGTVGKIILGSYRRGTHEPADMRGCRVDHPDIARAADELQDTANRLGVVPYDEGTSTGDLRYAWFRTDGAGNVLLTLVTLEARSAAATELPSQLHVPAGIAWGIQASPGNDMRGVTVRPLRGRQTVAVPMAGVTIHVGPLGFLQPNPQVAALAYRDLAAVPAGGAVRGHRAVDLYAGAGVTTALLRQHFSEVVPCEAYPESARALGVEPMLVEEFLSDVIQRGTRIDLAVANPPRGGLGPTVCEQLNRLKLPRLHIMSCSPQSLRDDLDRLTGEDGSYGLFRARAYDTLPHTPHLEIVAWLVGRRRR